MPFLSRRCRLCWGVHLPQRSSFPQPLKVGLIKVTVAMAAMLMSGPAVARADAPSAIPASPTTPDPATTPESGVLAGGVSAVPVLRLKTDGHAALITGAAVDDARRYLATASLDRTACVWDTATGKLLTTLRPPIGPGDEGKLSAIAVSPSGDLVACAGNTGFSGDDTCVYVFDRATGAMTMRIAGTKGPVNSLAYSRDGKYLAAGTGPLGGLTVFRARDGVKVGEDGDYRGYVASIDFAPPDSPGAPLRLVTSAGDGFVRLYKFLETASTPLRLVGSTDSTSDEYPGNSPAAMRRTLTTTAPEPGVAAFSPDGSLIAVGDRKYARLTVFAGDTLMLTQAHGVDALEPEEVLGTAPPGLRLGAVCWSADGATVYCGGLTGASEDHNAVYGFDALPADNDLDHGRSHPKDPVRLPILVGTIMGLFLRPDGGLLLAASDVPLGRLNTRGTSTGGPSAFHHTPYHFDAAVDLDVSDDGTVVRMPGTGDGTQRGMAMAPPALFRFDLFDRHRTADIGGGGDHARSSVLLKPPVTERPGVSIENWDNNSAPLFNRQLIGLSPEGACLCRAIAPDEQSFVLGTENSLQCFDQDLRQLWSHPASDRVLKVNVCGDGKTVVAALGDGTVRWYRMKDGAEICTLFEEPKGNGGGTTGRWVLWTPTGDYDCSAGGEALFGWHVNRGIDRASDLLPGDHFHAARYKPDASDTTDKGENAKPAGASRLLARPLGAG